MKLIYRGILAAIMVATLAVEAQTLAHPGWRGNGVTTDPWWKHAVIYEIYPRSFQDSDGDGIGDLKGITQRLDYLQTLGVDAIWLTPIFPSPQKDFGYDISDYTAIDPQYGTMDDFDELMREASRRGIRVIMDLVLNHTSDQHPWFIESASSRTNPKRDWYIWHDGKPAEAGASQPLPPNNWVDRLAQPAWQYDAHTGQFYYHFFAKEQPDLNWRNPAVKTAMFDAARFWLSHGVAGFRLDAVNTLFEDPTLRDAPTAPGTNEYGEPALSQEYQRNLPEVHGVMRDLRRVSDSYTGQRILIGEVYTNSTAELAPWYGPHHDELQLPMDTSLGFLNKLDAATLRRKLEEAATQLNGNTPLFVFDNHDRPRSWDRYGDGTHNSQIAKIIATILLASRSAALVYEGQEIGMATTPVTRKEDVRDPRGIDGWPKEKGRDGERTPMQWTGDAKAGFTTGTPWLPIPDSTNTTNVDAEQKSDTSLFNWYRQLIALRKSNAALRDGAITLLDHDAENALVWVRSVPPGASQRSPLVIACNLSEKPVTLHLHDQVKRLGLRGSFLRPILRSDDNFGPLNLDSVTLAPFTTFIGELRF